MNWGTKGFEIVHNFRKVISNISGNPPMGIWSKIKRNQKGHLCDHGLLIPLKI